MTENGTRRRLDSWKAIAQHLRRNERTVSRWEKERSLPVHRVPGGRVRTVFAYADELDEWLASHRAEIAAEEGNGRREGNGEGHAVVRHWRLAAAALLSLALPVLLWAVWNARFAPLDLDMVRADGRAVVAVDRSGGAPWTFVPPAPLAPGPLTLAWNAVGDLDGRAGSEVVAAAVGSWEAPDLLYAFSNRGDMLWQQSLGDAFSFGGTRYGPPWRSLAVTRYEIDGQPRIAWTTHHQTWWPSVMVTMDASGRLLDRFVNTGWLSSLKTTADGRFLLAAGVSNPHRAYALVVLDARAPGGSAPPTDDATYACADCPAGQPARYFTLGRSELEQIVDAPLYQSSGPPVIIKLPTGGIEVHARQSPDASGNAEAIYEFDSELNLQRARVSDAYWIWHRELERAGRIDHRAEDCPDQGGLPVREWTPNDGWRKLDAR